MANIVSISGKPIEDTEPAGPQPVAEVVESLERLLEEAKDGSLLSLAWVVTRTSGRVAFSWLGNNEGFGMLAGIALLQQDYLNASLEECEV